MRECIECENNFTPYDESDYLCDDCVKAQHIVNCSVCGNAFKQEDETENICGDCLIELQNNEE